MTKFFFFKFSLETAFPNDYVGEGRRDPSRSDPIPSPVQARMALCDAETAPEPPHKDQWHRGISERRLNTINNRFCRYYCRARPSPVDKKAILSLSRTAGGRRRWRQVADGTSGTIKQAHKRPVMPVFSAYVQTAVAARYIVIRFFPQ